MRKLLLGALLLLSTLSFSQIQKLDTVYKSVDIPLSDYGYAFESTKKSTQEASYDNKSGVYMGINYGTQVNSVGIEVGYSKEKRIAFGAGVSISFNSPNRIGIEEDIPFSWWETINIETGPVYSLYGLCGYEFKRIKLVGKLGVNKYETIQTWRSTASNTYWYSIIDTKTDVLLGSTLSYKIDRSWYLDGGYDTFNGVTFGTSYIF